MKGKSELPVFTQAGRRRPLGVTFKGTRFWNIESLLTTSIGQQKRNKHNLETLVLFVDLVKASDTVTRDALFAVLRRYGLPNQFLNIIIRLHKKVKIKVKNGSVDSEIESSIEVRQGSCEGPVLFLFIIQAGLETMKWPVPKPQFFIRENGVTIGERTERKWGTIKHEHNYSMYADDAVFFFNTREGLP
jgi:hypothetical protein